jgi:hypothetical protein
MGYAPEVDIKNRSKKIPKFCLLCQWFQKKQCQIIAGKMPGQNWHYRKDRRGDLDL